MWRQPYMGSTCGREYFHEHECIVSEGFCFTKLHVYMFKYNPLCNSTDLSQKHYTYPTRVYLYGPNLAENSLLPNGHCNIVAKMRETLFLDYFYF